MVEEPARVPADAGRRQKGSLRHHRLLEVRPPQPGHVPRRRPHGGGRGVPDRSRSRPGRHRHEDLRTHGCHRQDRVGQLPGEGVDGQARLGQAGPHPGQQRPLRVQARRGPQAGDCGVRGRGRPPRLPHVRPRGHGRSGHRQATDRRGRPHAQGRRAMVRRNRHSHPAYRGLQGHLVVRQAPPRRHREREQEVRPARGRVGRGALPSGGGRGDLGPCAGDQEATADPFGPQHQALLSLAAPGQVRRVRVPHGLQGDETPDLQAQRQALHLRPGHSPTLLQVLRDGERGRAMPGASQHQG